MHSESYWLDTAPAFRSGQSGPVEGQVDVAIVGGGFTGLSAARALAMKGARVAVFEAGSIIGEASGRNGGQCNTGVAQDYAALSAKLGTEQARAFYRAYEDAVASVDEIVRSESIDCDYSRNGKLKLAAKPQHYEGLARTCELIRRDVDANVELLSAAQVREEIDSDQFHGGLLQRNGVQMHVGRFGVGLAEGSAATVGKRGGKIRVAGMSSSTADTLDPAKGALSTDYARHFMFYNGLTRFDQHLVPQLELAERIDHTDASLWTITLRKDVTFHNGKALGAADVVYSLSRHKDPLTGSKVMPLMAQFEEIKATGPLEVQIRLSAPNAELPSILAVSHLLIVPEGTTDFSQGIGTGPFKAKEFRPGVRSISVRNENYWKPGLPYLDEIEFIAIADEPSRVNALLSGDVHMINEVNPRSATRISASAGHRVVDAPSGNYTDLIMRQDQMPTQSADFNQAMKYLLDREQIKSAVFRGYAAIGNDHPISPGSRYYNADLPQTPYDPDKARFLLKKAGLSDVRLPLVASPAATGSVDMAVLLQQSAKQAGLNLSVNRLPADGYWSNHWMKHPVSFDNINPRPNADIIFSQFFQSSAPWNESGWKNEQFDQLLMLARGETDDAKRSKMYADMQTLVHDHCGIGIPVFISNIDGVDQRIKGYGTNPLGGFMGYMFSEQVWLDA